MILTRSDDSDDDDTAELMAELAKIKQERAEEKARLVRFIVSGLFPLSGFRSAVTWPIHKCTSGIVTSI